MSLEELKSLDENGKLFSRNLDCTVAKDTVVVPKFGAVAIRFKADNPGRTNETSEVFHRRESLITALDSGSSR